MILTHLFLQRSQYFRAQIPRELIGGKEQRIFGDWAANQNAPPKLSTVLEYTKYNYSPKMGFLSMASNLSPSSLSTSENFPDKSLVPINTPGRGEAPHGAIYLLPDTQRNEPVKPKGFFNSQTTWPDDEGNFFK